MKFIFFSKERTRKKEAFTFALSSFFFELICSYDVNVTHTIQPTRENTEDRILQDTAHRRKQKQKFVDDLQKRINHTQSAS